LTAILNLKPEAAKQLHPLALKWFDDQSAAIEQQLAIDGLTVDDIETFLSDDEKDELRRYESEIEMALLTCITPNAVYPNPLPDGGPGPAFPMMQLQSFACIENMKSLLREVYRRKAATKPETVKRRDEAERRTRAFEALHSPIALARKYLNRPGEYERFEMSMSGAVDAYLEAGEFYIYQEKASAYLRCLEAVDDRRRQEMRKQCAQSAADAYNRRLNEEIRELTTRLHRRERNLSSYFRAMTKDNRYSGDDFDYILSEEETTNLDLVLISVANRQLERLCSEDLRQFIALPPKYYRRYYPLPSASYNFDEVPCLNFSFEIFAAAYAEICLRQGKKTFDGFEFSLPSVEEKDSLSLLKSPKSLGYYYSVIGPEDLDAHVFWKSISLILLEGLLNGETKPQGTTITAASDDSVTYQVQGYEDEIKIPDRFAEYLRHIGGIDRMASVGIITQKIANIVKDELADLKVEREALSIEESTKGRDSMKARAFWLFSEGKGPSSPEMRALGLHKSTRFKYYNEYLAGHKS